MTLRWRLLVTLEELYNIRHTHWIYHRNNKARTSSLFWSNVHSIGDGQKFMFLISLGQLCLYYLRWCYYCVHSSCGYCCICTLPGNVPACIQVKHTHRNCSEVDCINRTLFIPRYNLFTERAC
jgi:hypothetical protein